MISHDIETIESEVEQDVICDKCCKVFESLKSLKVHVNDVHEKEETKEQESPMKKREPRGRPRKDFEAAQPSQAQPEKQVLLCDKCFKSFESKEKLDLHRRISHTKLYNIVYQKEETKELESPMNKGITKDVEAARPSPAQPEKQALLCDKCFECFESKENLDLHKRTNHTKSYNIVYQKDAMSEYKERYSTRDIPLIESVSLILILFRYFPFDK